MLYTSLVCDVVMCCFFFFFFSSRRRHTRYWRDWSSDVCSSDLSHVRASLYQGPRVGASGRRYRHRRHQRPRAGSAGRRGVRRTARHRPRGGDWRSLRRGREREGGERRLQPARWHRDRGQPGDCRRSRAGQRRADRGRLVLQALRGGPRGVRGDDGRDRLRRLPGQRGRMSALAELTALEAADGFVARPIGPSETELAEMLRVLGAASLEEVAAKTVPQAIRTNRALNLPPAVDEAAVIAELRALADKNVLKKSLIGMGYHGTHTPPLILRNVLENPGWYTAYTPYQAEVAQGRLEALVNYQTLICELTAMEIANASLLDEATAAAEAMAMAHGISKSKSDVLAVAADLHPQTRAVLAPRAKPIGITLVDVTPGDAAGIAAAQPFAVVDRK